MLEIIVSAGTSIDDACLWTARLARLPLSKSVSSGSYYAFGPRHRVGAIDWTDGWMALAAGPWHDSECTEESRRGQRFRGYCKEMRCEYSFIAQCVGGEPGVQFELNGITVACDSDYGKVRSILKVANDLYDLYMCKRDARLEGIRG